MLSTQMHPFVKNLLDLLESVIQISPCGEFDAAPGANQLIADGLTTLINGQGLASWRQEMCANPRGAMGYSLWKYYLRRLGAKLSRKYRRTNEIDCALVSTHIFSLGNFNKESWEELQRTLTVKCSKDGDHSLNIMLCDKLEMSHRSKVETQKSLIVKPLMPYQDIQTYITRQLVQAGLLPIIPSQFPECAYTPIGPLLASLHQLFQEDRMQIGPSSTSTSSAQHHPQLSPAQESDLPLLQLSRRQRQALARREAHIARMNATRSSMQGVPADKLIVLVAADGHPEKRGIGTSNYNVVMCLVNVSRSMSLTRARLVFRGPATAADAHNIVAFITSEVENWVAKPKDTAHFTASSDLSKFFDPACATRPAIDTEFKLCLDGKEFEFWLNVSAFTSRNPSLHSPICSICLKKLVPSTARVQDPVTDAEISDTYSKFLDHPDCVSKIGRAS